MKLTFKNAELQGILEITKKGEKFFIPHNAMKTQTKPTIWLVKDSGIYLMPSASDRPQPLGDKNLCYAQGYGKNAHVSGDDFVEEIPFDDKLRKFMEDGYDLIINLTANSMSIGAVKRPSEISGKVSIPKISKP